MQRSLRIAVVGAGAGPPELLERARAVGAAVARAGAALVCGGGGGVMSAAAEGATREGGATVGILPGRDARESPPNDWIATPVFTGLGQARNLAVVLTGEAVVAVGGGWGTLSEIALALKHRIPVVTLGSWRLERPDGAAEPLLQRADTPDAAVRRALAAAERHRHPRETLE